MDHYNGMFDFAHARMIAPGIRNYRSFIDRLAGIVKPNGLIQLFETDFKLYYAKHEGATFEITSSVDDPGHSWFHDWQTILLMAFHKMGGNPEAGSMNRDWVKENPAFREVEYKDLWFPTGPFLPGEFIAERMHPLLTYVIETSEENIHHNGLVDMLIRDVGVSYAH